MGYTETSTHYKTAKKAERPRLNGEERQLVREGYNPDTSIHFAKNRAPEADQTLGKRAIDALLTANAQHKLDVERTEVPIIEAEAETPRVIDVHDESDPAAAIEINFADVRRDVRGDIILPTEVNERLSDSH
ncbi:MAG: hypothetical protein JWN38_664 [Candidatus Saccharibacteria bacterium]|nr:hypothetical protein [Candidatus Saccharibacteria bacterium]